ncbi:MAG TPA: hypothetical protein ENK50_01300 [Sedimenticola sp.]|nr:hypothetical protein [Sedimenticola sp.]
MIKLLIIETGLFVVIGAVVFRLAWAFTKKWRVAWGSILVLAAILFIFVPGTLDESLIIEFGGKHPPKFDFNPLEINLFRCLGLVLGAWLASRILAARKRLGLEDEPPFDDFP